MTTKRPSLILAAMLLGFVIIPARAQYTINTLAYFGLDKLYPVSGVTLSPDGNTLYGTAIFGGQLGFGEVFATSTSPTQSWVGGLASLYSPSNPGLPMAGVTLSADGSTVYGTTLVGGVNKSPTIFSVPATGGTATILSSFIYGNLGPPTGPLVLSGNVLYGTTGSGGASGLGAIFSLPITGGAPTVLASFSGNSTGTYPHAGVTLSADGTTLYGVVGDGGDNGDGEIISVPIAGGTPTILASFDGSNGQYPETKLTLSADGSKLFGVTYEGGAYGNGEVFSVPTAGGSPTVLTSFNVENAEDPNAGLALSSDGTTLYGTMPTGGANDDGKIFSIPTTGGTPTVLASFDGDDGSEPLGGLTLSADGSTLYGTTFAEGPSLGANGIVFSLTLPEPSSLPLLVLCGLAYLRPRQVSHP